jgi:hypothetical protein
MLCDYLLKQENSGNSAHFFDSNFLLGVVVESKAFDGRRGADNVDSRRRSAVADKQQQKMGDSLFSRRPSMQVDNNSFSYFDSSFSFFNNNKFSTLPDARSTDSSLNSKGRSALANAFFFSRINKSNNSKECRLLQAEDNFFKKKKETKMFLTENFSCIKKKKGLTQNDHLLQTEAKKKKI